MAENAVALVTGASSGFGREIARRLAERGYRVFGTSRHPSATRPERVEIVRLDVGSEDSVRACVGAVLDSAGRIDLLVNNAGTTHVSVVEETDLATARAVLDTNFFGVARVTGAVLPGMRARRSGRIINICSLGGLLAIPGQAFYTASKFALEGYTEALRYEVERFGIHVTLVEPGFYKTRLHESMAGEARRLDDYDALREILQGAIARSFDRGGDPQEVADLVLRVAAERSPRLRYRIGPGARWVPVLKNILPERMFAIGMRRRFDLTAARGVR
jgi:NAD(P)-dependent dehydrogenase (short-subunit alcohol dehydrogenase family)